VALIAQDLLSPATRSKVNKLLVQAGERDLVSVAFWADEVVWAARGEGPLTGDPEALEFSRKFPNNRKWHFVNLPLGAGADGEEVPTFTSLEDVVHAISRCIGVLEMSSAEFDGLTKIEALRLLVHFVADLHQPLHCGTGYYSFDPADTAQLISFPAEAFGKPNDRGGNLLFYGATPSEQLHALWDSVIVERVDGSADYRALAHFLVENYLPDKNTCATAGDYHRWAELWAVESVRVATLAYLGISFGKAIFDANGNLARIEIKLPADYLKTNVPYAAVQLTVAGVRLARLLEAIKWPAAER
jgi:S1/P1 nuclease